MKMKAAVYKKYGPPEVVMLTEVNKPVPRRNEILIKVHATTVNRTDCGFRSANYFVSRFFSGLLKPKRNILGSEFSGSVEAIGAEVSRFKVGDRVFGYNDIRFGAHAEYMTLPETDALTFIPDGLTFEQAAPIAEGAHYALCDIRAAHVKPGQQVMVYGASGAIGSAAVQLAMYFGAEVTAVCSTAYVEKMESLKPSEIIDYTKKDFTQTSRTFDLIFDAVGKSSFRKCSPLLKKDGIYLSTEPGKNAENLFLALRTRLTGGKKVIFPLPSIKQEDVVFLKELVEAGQYHPLIDRVYPFHQIVEAYRYVETGQKAGNVVITLT